MRITLLLIALLLVACGGATSAVDPGTESDAGSDAPVYAGLDVVVPDEPSPGRNPECPGAVPPAGGPCKPILTCDYGDDVHHVCRTRVNCTSSDGATFKWVVNPPADGCGTNAPSCPTAFTALAEGSPCPGTGPDFNRGEQMSSFCSYQEGRCGCVHCDGDAGASSMWVCRKWGPTQDGCPAVSPLSGDACGMPNQSCSYGGFCRLSVGPDMICDGGYWKEGFGLTGSCLIPQCGQP
jgi:hypothetical protein